MAKLRTFLLPLAFAFAALTQTAEAQVFVNGGAPGPHTVVGWNYGHISNCSTLFDGSTTWFSVIMLEGGSGYTNNPAFASMLSGACQTGNWIGVNVTSLNPFHWTQVVTYTFK
ncbi:MAG TPA: hypothetical protein VKF40_02335 [Burkholderiales bacterium]|nr:hypothetical protein [Burkholderiales bacterium]